MLKSYDELLNELEILIYKYREKHYQPFSEEPCPSSIGITDEEFVILKNGCRFQALNTKFITFMGVPLRKLLPGEQRIFGFGEVASGAG